MSNRKDQVGSHSGKSAEIREGRHHRWERCGVQTENETEQRRQKHRTRKTSARWLCVGQAREKKQMEYAIRTRVQHRTWDKWTQNHSQTSYLLQSIVMPNFLYGLSVNGASSSNLNNVQHFLNRYYKRRYISRKLNMRELLERSDCRIFRKALRTNSPLVKILPERNFTNYSLRKPWFYHPIVATERFKSSYVNRLILS